MPGGYCGERGADDLAVGALYDRGVYLYALGMMGPYNDDIGGSAAKYVRDHFPQFRPKRILDMGWTVGHSTLPFVDAFPDAEVHAIDVGAPLLRYAHARAESLGRKVHFSQQDASRTNFPDGHFDLICSSILFHETSAKALPAIVRECHRLLAHEGLAVHGDLPPFWAMDEFNQFMLDCETWYNDIKRSIKGRRPQFFQDPAIDQLHGMVMAMATEMAVLYERIDTMERVGAGRGISLREELARYRPDAAAQTEREAWRRRFLARLFYLYREDLDDRLGQENEAQYQDFLKDIS